MIGLFIPLILLLILILMLIIPCIIQVSMDNNEVNIKLILFKVIKIKIKEKTTYEKLKKGRRLRNKVPLKKIIEIIKESLPSINYLASRTEVNVEFNGILGLSSADKTALTIGILNMLLYSVEGFLHNYFKSYTGQYDINPDYANEKLEYCVFVEASILPIYIVVFSIKWLKVLLKYKKYILRKGGASNARSSNRRIDENYNG